MSDRKEDRAKVEAIMKTRISRGWEFGGMVAYVSSRGVFVGEVDRIVDAVQQSWRRKGWAVPDRTHNPPVWTLTHEGRAKLIGGPVE